MKCFSENIDQIDDDLHMICRQIDQITEEPELEIEYLTIEVLGQVLKFLNESEVVQGKLGTYTYVINIIHLATVSDKVHPKRSFSARVWKTGLPNLVIKKPGNTSLITLSRLSINQILFLQSIF